MDYRLFLFDLPKRALEHYKSDPSVKDKTHDVTLLLTMCWAVFVVPIERLDLLESRESPARDSEFNSESVKKALDDWCIFKNKSVRKIVAAQPSDLLFVKKAKSLSLQQAGEIAPGSEGWFAALKNENKVDDILVYDILTCLRHGLSHGNIWTSPPTDGRGDMEIENLAIANYPPHSRCPSILVIKPSVLLNLAEKFVSWLEKNTQLAGIGSMAMSESGDVDTTE